MKAELLFYDGHKEKIVYLTKNSDGNLYFSTSKESYIIKANPYVGLRYAIFGGCYLAASKNQVAQSPINIKRLDITAYGEDEGRAVEIPHFDKEMVFIDKRGG